MKHAIAVLALCTVAAGCERTVLPVDPLAEVDIAMVERPARGDVPAHFELVASAAGHDHATVGGALQVKAQDTCGEGRIGEFLGGTNPYEVSREDPAIVRFTCVPAPLPGRTDLAAGEDMPTQPARAPGQVRNHSWGSGWGEPGSVRRISESLLGSRMRSIYAEACEGRGVDIDRIATYVQPIDGGAGHRTDLVIDYTCEPDVDAPVADAAAP